MLSPMGFDSMVKSGLFKDVVVVSHDMEKRIAERSSVEPLPKSQRNLRDDVYDPKDDWYYRWHNYDVIQNRLQAIASNFSFATYSTIGESHEGRKIGVLNFKGYNATRTIALIGGTHAREWLAEGVLLWALGCISELYGHNKVITQIIDSLDLYVCPCYNPDGYDYSLYTDRYWRKNRRDNQDGSFGVDQNRNWDAVWGTVGGSTNTSSLVYYGPSVLSEPEVSAMHDFLHNLDNSSIIVDVHSPLTAFMRPFYYTLDPCSNDEELRAIGDKFVQIVNSIHGQKLRSIRSGETYLASGTCTDAMYLAGYHKAFILELGDGDFVVPVTEIQRQGESVFAGLLYLLSSA